MGIKFARDPLAVEENYCDTKIVNAYIVYDLDAWPKILLIISYLKIACSVQLV